MLFSEAGNISLCWRAAEEMWRLYLPRSSCWEWGKVGLEYFFSVIVGYFVLHYILSLPLLVALSVISRDHSVSRELEGVNGATVTSNPSKFVHCEV